MEIIFTEIFCEAFIGAIYLDKGFPFCEKFIHEKIIKPYVDIARLEGKVISYKSLIIEWCQKEKINHLNLRFLKMMANEGVKHFGVKLLMDNEVISKARATSKEKSRRNGC